MLPDAPHLACAANLQQLGEKIGALVQTNNAVFVCASYYDILDMFGCVFSVMTKHCTQENGARLTRVIERMMVTCLSVRLIAFTVTSARRKLRLRRAVL